MIRRPPRSTQSRSSAASDVYRDSYEGKIVTELSALPPFYAATQEHQDFYKNNNGQGYCTYVIEPKLAKLRKMHAEKLK